MDIAVVIPTVGRPELRRALESVVHQNHPAAEIVVVDNGLDHSIVTRLVQELAPRAILLRLPYRSGPSASRNAGASVASAPYIAFLDDDDEFSQDYLRAVSRRIELDKPDVVYTTKESYRRDGSMIGTKRISSVPQAEWMDRWYAHENPGVGGTNLIVRTATFKSLGGFHERLRTTEDRAFAMAAYVAGAKIVHVDAVVKCHEPEGDRARKHRSKPIAKLRIMRQYWPHVEWRTRIRSLRVLLNEQLRPVRRRVGRILRKAQLRR